MSEAPISFEDRLAAKREAFRLRAEEQIERESIREDGLPPPKPATPADACPTLGKAALYGLAGDIVRTIEPESEGHPAAILLQLLTLFGNAVGRSPHVCVGAAFHHTNLYVAVTGPTATGRKGVSLEWPLHIVREAAGVWRPGGGLSTGEGLIAAVADLSQEELKEGVEARDKRLCCVETEFGRTLRVGQREANTLFPVIQQLWDSGDASVRTRKNPISTTDAHVSIIVHVTPDVLIRRLDALNATEGFANRFLFCYSTRTKKLAFGGSLTDADIRPLITRVTTALDTGRPLCEFKMDGEAREYWEDAYEKFPELPGLMGEVTQRAAPQVLRLALIYALMGGTGAKVIRQGHIEAALALWQYSVDSAKFIFGTKTGDRIADRINTCCQAVYPDSLTDKDVYGIFGNHVSGLQLETAAELLEAHGLVRRTEAPRPRGGNPSGQWRAIR